MTTGTPHFLDMHQDPLHIDPDTMRRMGYDVVDFLVERITNLPNQRASTAVTRAELEPRLTEPPPPHAHEFHELLTKLRDDVLAYGVRVDHPRFFAFVPGAFTWPAVLGDA